MLALRGTPWDAKGRLATPVPRMGGLPPPTAAAASATGGTDATSILHGAQGSTDVGPGVAPRPAEQRAQRISRWLTGRRTCQKKASKM
eukprot:6259244-Amphidinium_carterae.1